MSNHAVDTETLVHITLREEIAEVVTALLGAVENPTQGVADLFYDLDQALPNRTKSFSDFFEGQVRTLQDEDE